MRVLLVEDDDLIGQGIVTGLRRHGLAVHHVRSAAKAEAAQAEDAFQAMVLDVGLPDRDGIELLGVVRRIDPKLPVIILSARDSVAHRLAGLHGGADDYLTKPFDLGELAARLHALIRRTLGRAVDLIVAGPLRLDPDSGQAWLNDAPVALSQREMDLLAYLASAPGHWMSVDSLNERLYGLSVDIGSNALNVHIHNIRRKLGHEAIETARGLGYRLGWTRQT